MDDEMMIIYLSRTEGCVAAVVYLVATQYLHRTEIYLFL